MITRDARKVSFDRSGPQLTFTATEPYQQMTTQGVFPDLRDHVSRHDMSYQKTPHAPVEVRDEQVRVFSQSQSGSQEADESCAAVIGDDPVDGLETGDYVGVVGFREIMDRGVRKALSESSQCRFGEQNITEGGKPYDEDRFSP